MLAAATVVAIQQSYAAFRRKAIAIAKSFGVTIAPAELDVPAMVESVVTADLTEDVALAAPIVDGITPGIGPFLTALLAAVTELPATTQWMYGATKRKAPFVSHQSLDGLEFSSWKDPRLAVLSQDSWLNVEHYAPGDHYGCQCRAIPIYAE